MGKRMNDEAYTRIIRGAMASTESVGVMKKAYHDARKSLRKCRPQYSRCKRGDEAVPERGARAVVQSRAEILRNYRLRRLTYAVGTALYERAHRYDNTVNGKCI